ncbi:RRQRL motif-containing zinc-binding protein [Streptomyces violaceusniger]|uniref:RRQRL motif-containing zinc-binding protein n=1 Tax=Streptomyces violaceusniger TaxID=68280 RepID=UPI0034459778
MPRTDLRFLDPEGKRYGIPTWPWRMGPPPEEWATLRQLKARGLRPGGQRNPIGGQLGWQSGDGPRFAYLYRVELALPKRPMTEARWASIRKATQARQICPACGEKRDYEIPKRYGVCNDCPGGANEAAA